MSKTVKPVIPAFLTFLADVVEIYYIQEYRVYSDIILKGHPRYCLKENLL